MTSLRPMSVFVAGLAVTLLLLGLPILHLGWRPVGVELALLLLPSAALVAVVWRPSLSWLTHLAFPVSHLPLLVLRPELTSSEIYGGARGVLALVATLAALVVYLVAVTPRLVTTAGGRSPRVMPEAARAQAVAAPPSAASPAKVLVSRDVGSTRAWPPGASFLLLGLGFALGPALALTLPALAGEAAPLDAAFSILLGPLVALGAVGLGLSKDLLLDPVRSTHGAPVSTVDVLRRGESPLHRAALATLAVQCRPRSRAFIWASLLVLSTLGLTAFWYLWSPR